MKDSKVRCFERIENRNNGFDRRKNLGIIHYRIQIGFNTFEKNCLQQEKIETCPLHTIGIFAVFLPKDVSTGSAFRS